MASKLPESLSVSDGASVICPRGVGLVSFPNS